MINQDILLIYLNHSSNRYLKKIKKNELLPGQLGGQSCAAIYAQTNVFLQHQYQLILPNIF